MIRYTLNSLVKSSSSSRNATLRSSLYSSKSTYNSSSSNSINSLNSFNKSFSATLSCSVYKPCFSVQYFSSHSKASPNAELVPITFIDKEGQRIDLKVPEGTSLLDIAHDNDIDLEGACEGSVACSTCHCYIEPKFYEKLEQPTDEENDMLDLAFDLKTNSRLGCQVIVTKELSGMEVTLPSATRNMSVDGYKPPRH
ncbi:hypothetical protein PPL_01095 [Heterostelium album PN500]|uniref:2Fe-2S ferredoxin-type domain-containing protein n=1 Tax=Heterostelium pallidum (strain ATCC 26659 / Pp 5 / PN500) TaxID=670386 RepID=D3AY36_HETP5|nr:hypothetical protein PPL_01095 [Heterostelium album PN500]EFA85863.1 hypothetical protein PPL_01095 [Heterostelium album PN500]|eukprot:XP_020437969.1 hypothetical protein PPL_01095 [Heterostelium album PN500]